MTNIMERLVKKHNFNTEEELMNLAKTKLKYNLFQIFLERKNPNSELPPYCNAVTIFYKGIDLVEIYPEEDERLQKYNILNISGSTRKKIMFEMYKNEIFFQGEEHALEVLLDDNYYPQKTLKTKKDKKDAIGY